jgi:hypothetical protein
VGRVTPTVVLEPFKPPIQLAAIIASTDGLPLSSSGALIHGTSLGTGLSSPLSGAPMLSEGW